MIEGQPLRLQAQFLCEFIEQDYRLKASIIGDSPSGLRVYIRVVKLDNYFEKVDRWFIELHHTLAVGIYYEGENNG